jgi:Na+/phosphate symporter
MAMTNKQLEQHLVEFSASLTLAAQRLVILSDYMKHMFKKVSEYDETGKLDKELEELWNKHTDDIEKAINEYDDFMRIVKHTQLVEDDPAFSEDEIKDNPSEDIPKIDN